MMEESGVRNELSELCGLSETWSPENLASILKTFWRNLEVKNTEDFAKRKEDKIPFMILSREIIDMVFCIGRRLNQTTEAQFITIEILDRFIISEIMAVWNWSRSTDSAKWERALLLVKKQFMLRLLCCVGIASKIEGSPGRVLKPKVLARYLSTNDRAITIRAVCLSELHILRLIDYKPPLISSLTYVNALCCLLSSCRPMPPALATTAVASQLWEVSGRILRLATVAHHWVYDNLAEFARRNSGSNVSDEDLVSARCDRILLSVATVALSAMLVTTTDAESLLLCGEVSPGSTALGTVSEVSALTGIAHQDVEAMVAVLAHTTGLLDALLRQKTQQLDTAASPQPSTSRELPGGIQGININHWLGEAHTFVEVARQVKVTERRKNRRNCHTPHPYGKAKNRSHCGKFLSPDCHLVNSTETTRNDSGIGTSHQTGRNPPCQLVQPTLEGSPSGINTRTYKGKGRLNNASAKLYLCRNKI